MLLHWCTSESDFPFQERGISGLACVFTSSFHKQGEVEGRLLMNVVCRELGRAVDHSS